DKGVAHHHLIEMLQEVQERQVEQVHRLIQAWIDLEFLLELGALLETSFHCTSPPPLPFSSSRRSSWRFEELPLPSPAAWPLPSVLEKRARRRAVRVGPRLMSATLRSKRSSLTGPV